MPISTLRASGGAVVVSVPKKLLELVNLRVGSKVEIAIKGGALIVNAAKPSKPRYTLEEVLGHCSRNAFRKSRAAVEWLEDRPLGKEAL